MRPRIVLALLGAVLTCGLLAAPALAGTAIQLKRPTPAWYTPALHRLVLAAGPLGVQVSEEQLNIDCPGFAAEGVAAGGCIVFPYGCTANNIFSDGISRYIGTARHCVDVDNRTGEPIFFPDEGDGGNDTATPTAPRPLVMQVDATTVAQVGQVIKHTAGTGDPGQDFALVQLDPLVVDEWGVNPEIPVIGGPQGVYDGCATQTVMHYGHGYEVAVSQGYARAGLATNWLNSGYGWTGQALGGDSGSPVVIGDGRSAGNLTHLVVDFQDYPGSDVAGMRMTAILQFLGGGISLANADGTFATSGPASCEGGSGGGGGKGGGGKGGGGKGGGKGDGGKGGGKGGGKKNG